MRKRLLHHLSFTKPLRLVLILLTLLLTLPQTAWGQTTYDIWIGHTQVTDENALNITGDHIEGSLSFDAGNNILTLNNATITPEGDAVGITYTGTDDLTISLNGTNTVKGSGGCPAIVFNDNGSPVPPNLTFINGGTDPCSLQLEATSTQTINGFGNVINTGLYKIEETITGNEGTTYKTTITSTILSGGSGTATDPIIIKTADDLKKFAQYINDKTIGSGVSVKLSDDIPESGLDCGSLTGFQPIGIEGNEPIKFTGTFDGNNKIIKNLSVTNVTGEVVGLFRYLDGGTITQLILDGCTISGGSSGANDIGGIVGNVSNNGTISKCKVQNGSTISCNANTQNPTVGGFVGYLSSGTITECVLQDSYVKAETSDDVASGGLANAGGIVGKTAGGTTVNKCQVKGTAEISAIYPYAPYTNAGAIVGDKDDATLSENTYDYLVKTKVQNSTQQTELTTYSGYTHRGTNATTDPAGVSLYTKIVSLPTVVSATGTVVGVEGTYYKVDDTSLYVAPGQRPKINATPNTTNNFVLTGLQAVKTGTTDVVTCDSTDITGGGRQYTFEMPDVDVTVSVSWNELYDLWIGDTQVTSANAAHILGGSNTTVVFTVADPKDGSPNTLTLNGATLTVPVKVGLANLTIDIQGTNSITTEERCIQKMDNTTPAVTFTSTSAEVGSLTLNGAAGVNSVGEYNEGSFTISDKLALVLKKDGYIYSNTYWFTDGSTKKAILSPSYGVTIGGMQICKDNAADIIGEGIGDGDDSGMVSFNKETNTLTLNKADISGAISTSLAELTVELVGDNTISAGDDPAFQSSSGNAVSINIQSTAEEKGNLTMNCNTGVYFYDNHVTLHIVNPLDVVSGSLTGSGTVIIGEDYKLTVGGTAVTFLNKDNVLGDTEISVTFTPSSNTLNLNGATINGDGGIYYSGTTTLTFALNGANSIINTGGTYAIGASTYTDGLLKFEKATGSSNAELTLTWGSGSVAISASNPALGSGLYWKPTAETTLVITDDPEFVIVDGYVITDAASVAGAEGEVRYDSSNKILTLDGYSKAHATGKHAIKTGVTNLKVKLIGESTISCISDSAIFHAFCNSASIQFVKNDATSKLTMTGTAFDNFAANNITYDGLVYYSEGNYIAVPTAPTMAVNDDNKVELTINYSGGTIKYSIDYADETADVTGATYSEPFAMAAPGTVTAWVDQNGATVSSTVKGKYFGYKDAPFTLKADLVDPSKSETLIPQLIPAFVDGENINITTATTPYLSSATDVATFTDGTITAVGIGTATVTANIDYTADVHPVVILNPDKKVTAEVKVGTIPAITFVDDRTYATFCNTGDKDLTVPDGLTAYAVTGVNGTVVTLAEVNFLPKVNGTDYVALLLKREDPSTTVGIAEEFTGGTRPTSNQLKYAISDVPTTGVEFVLYKDEFVKATGSIPANKCYLDLNGVSFTRGAYGIGDGTTAIDATLIENEETNDNWYDLQGRRIQQPTKAGLYIKNGKKVIVNTK